MLKRAGPRARLPSAERCAAEGAGRGLPSSPGAPRPAEGTERGLPSSLGAPRSAEGAGRRLPSPGAVRQRTPRGCGVRGAGRGCSGRTGGHTQRPGCCLRPCCPCSCSCSLSVQHSAVERRREKYRCRSCPRRVSAEVSSFLRFVHRHQGSFYQPVPSPSICLRHALQLSLALSLQSCFSTCGLLALKADCFSCTERF